MRISSITNQFKDMSERGHKAVDPQKIATKKLEGGFEPYLQAAIAAQIKSAQDFYDATVDAYARALMKMDAEMVASELEELG